MAGVQCEQCHGPLKNHMEEEGKLPFAGGGFAAGMTNNEGAAKRQYQPDWF